VHESLKLKLASRKFYHGLIQTKCLNGNAFLSIELSTGKIKNTRFLNLRLAETLARFGHQWFELLSSTFTRELVTKTLKLRWLMSTL
jgi:hypothetical protein